jgi:preprotein translocase subunit SecE
VTEALGSTATPERGRPEDQASQSRRGGKRKKQGPLGRLATFYRQIIAELRKVVWPKRNDLVTYTTVVITFVVIMIALVYVIDFGFSKLIDQVYG